MAAMKSKEVPITNTMQLGFEGRHWASLSRSDRKRLFRRLYAHIVFPDNDAARDAFLLIESAKRLEKLKRKQSRRRSTRRQEKIAEEMAFSNELSAAGDVETVKKELRRAARDHADVAYIVSKIIALYATDPAKIGKRGKASTNRALYLSEKSLTALRQRLTERNASPESKLKADIIHQIVSGTEKNYWRKWRKRHRSAHLIWAMVYHMSECHAEFGIDRPGTGRAAKNAYLNWIADHFDEWLTSALFAQKILTKVIASGGQGEGTVSLPWQFPEALVRGLSTDYLEATELGSEDLAALAQYVAKSAR